MGCWQFMNLLMFGFVIGVVLGVFYLVVNYFIFFKVVGSGGGISVKDELGNLIIVSGWFFSYFEGDCSLVQGFKGDFIYLIVEGEDVIGSYGINVICIYFGCVVFWNSGVNKFMCFCYGSQYDVIGKVVCGFVFFFLVLVNVSVENDNVFVSQWIEIDF